MPYHSASSVHPTAAYCTVVKEALEPKFVGISVRRVIPNYSPCRIIHRCCMLRMLYVCNRKQYEVIFTEPAIPTNMNFKQALSRSRIYLLERATHHPMPIPCSIQHSASSGHAASFSKLWSCRIIQHDPKLLAMPHHSASSGHLTAAYCMHTEYEYILNLNTDTNILILTLILYCRQGGPRAKAI